jgi:hypothetical protein
MPVREIVLSVKNLALYWLFDEFWSIDLTGYLEGIIPAKLRLKPARK